MTLMVVRAEEVREGEPRWWYDDEGMAADGVEDCDPDMLHTESAAEWVSRHGFVAKFAIVDRPAAPPQPAASTGGVMDLDDLRAHLGRMTDQPWHISDETGRLASRFRGLENQHGGADLDEQDKAGIVAIVNAAPALLAEIKRLRMDARAKAGDCCPDWKVARVHHLDCPMMMRDADQRAQEGAAASAGLRATLAARDARIAELEQSPDAPAVDLRALVEAYGQAEREDAVTALTLLHHSRGGGSVTHRTRDAAKDALLAALGIAQPATTGEGG